jgi:hypothetical protein
MPVYFIRGEPLGSAEMHFATEDWLFHNPQNVFAVDVDHPVYPTNLVASRDVSVFVYGVRPQIMGVLRRGGNTTVQIQNGVVRYLIKDNTDVGAMSAVAERVGAGFKAFGGALASPFQFISSRQDQLEGHDLKHKLKFMAQDVGESALFWDPVKGTSARFEQSRKNRMPMDVLQIACTAGNAFAAAAGGPNGNSNPTLAQVAQDVARQFDWR